jgi:uncharacterized protein with gpF-like domain
LISPSGKPAILAPVRPNIGIEAAYRARLDAWIDEMARSVLYWVGASYKRNEPEVAVLARDGALALDASPARSLLATLAELTRRWQSRFDALAPDLAQWFAAATKDRSDATLRSALRRGGMTVRFQMTRAANDVYQATIGENVGLIRSIPAQYLTQVEGIVMRGVQAGRDLGYVATELQNQLGVTSRRAALISRDQNNKATATINRVSQQQIGIVDNIWMHSAGGREPRPSHVKAGRERTRYKIAEGWYDPDEGEYIWPGTLINCRCVSRPVLPGR